MSFRAIQLTNYLFTMALLGCVLATLLGLIVSIEGQAHTNTTDANRPINSTGTKQPAAPHYKLSAHTRAVLIAQTDNRTALRDGDDYRSLKYLEYDEKGALLNEVFMYNLKDVSEFFVVYLGTKICRNTCAE